MNDSGHAPIIAYHPTNVSGHATTSAYPPTNVRGHTTITAYPPRYLGEHATIWNRVSSFLISVYLDLESWFKLRFFYLLCNIAFFRPSECYIQLRKYSVGRRDALSCRSKYFDGHHNAFSKCGNTLSAVTMLYSVEASILSRVVMLSPIAEVLCRASECSIR